MTKITDKLTLSKIINSCGNKNLFTYFKSQLYELDKKGDWIDLNYCQGVCFQTAINKQDRELFEFLCEYYQKHNLQKDNPDYFKNLKLIQEIIDDAYKYIGQDKVLAFSDIIANYLGVNMRENETESSDEWLSEDSCGESDTDVDSHYENYHSEDDTNVDSYHDNGHSEDDSNSNLTDLMGY